MLPSLLHGYWQDLDLYRVWQTIIRSSLPSDSPLREATQKEPERSQKDGARTLHDLVSEVVETILAHFCSTHTQWTEVTQRHVHQGTKLSGAMLDDIYKTPFSSLTIFKSLKISCCALSEDRSPRLAHAVALGSPGSLFVFYK